MIIQVNGIIIIIVEHSMNQYNDIKVEKTEKLSFLKPVFCAIKIVKMCVTLK